MIRRSIWLEVDFQEEGVYIWDWTEFQGCDNWHRLKREFVKVTGKSCDYHVMGLENYEQARSFAIWYYANKEDGKISKYRLD